MNARQKCKKLKQRNKLLMDIVNGNPDFLRIFDNWTRGQLRCEISHVRLKKYAATSPIDPMLGEYSRRFAEDHVVRELSRAIKQHTEWREVDCSPFGIILEGRISVAEKERGNANGKNESKEG